MWGSYSILQSLGPASTPVDKDCNCTGSDAITNKRDAVVPPSRPVDPRTVHRCYVGDSPQPTWEEYGEGLHSPLLIRSQARLTKTVKVSYRVAEAHAGSDRRFLPSHTRVSLFCGRMQEGWVLIRQHSGSLSTGSSAGRLFRRRLNVQSGHREVRRARRGMHQAMPREKGNTEKVGMVTCCQEPRGRGPLKRCQSLVFRNATGFYRQLKQVLVDDEVLTHTRVHVEMHSVDTGKLGIEKKVFRGTGVAPGCTFVRPRLAGYCRD